ncbi:MAG: hypothetical protein GX076_03825 [Clostridiales bacterium]|nr:hypothetical protein [Clostridiales bacterium]
MNRFNKKKTQKRILHLGLILCGVFLLVFIAPLSHAYASDDIPTSPPSSPTEIENPIEETDSSGSGSEADPIDDENSTEPPDDGSGTDPLDEGSGTDPSGGENGSDPSGDEDDSGLTGCGDYTDPPDDGDGTDPSGDGNGTNPSDDGNGTNPSDDENGAVPSGDDNGSDTTGDAGEGNESEKSDDGIGDQPGDGIGAGGDEDPDEGVDEGEGTGNDESTGDDEGAETGQAGEDAGEPGTDEAGIQSTPDQYLYITISGTLYDSLTKEAINSENLGIHIDLLDENGEYIIGTSEEGGRYIYDESYGEAKLYDDGNYIFKFSKLNEFPLEDGKEYTVSVNVTGNDYESYAWSFIITHDSILVEKVYDLDFYLAPKKIKVKNGEEEQVVDSGISGSWASLNNKVVIDQDLIYPGYNLGIESAEEGIFNKPFEEIIIKEGVTITTRKVEEGEGSSKDYVDGKSVATSGAILIQGERVYIKDGVKILAHVEEGSEYSAGDITIKSYAVGGTDFIDILPGVDIDHPQAIIEVGKNSIIKGKDISFTATANSSEIFHPEDSDEDLVIDTSEEKFQWLHNLLNKTLGTTLGFVEDFSLVAGVSVAKATSKISIGDNSLIEAVSFEALSYSYVEAAAAPIAIAAGVAVGVGITDSQVIVDGNIITVADCTLKSLADNTLQVAGTSGGMKGLSAGIAVSVLESTSKVNIGDNAELQVGGNLTVEAKTIDRNSTFARSTTDENGKVGIAVAFSYENGVTEAILGGNVDVEGDISVVAYATREKIDGKKLFIIPTVNDGVYAYAGANTSSTGDLSDDLKAKITGPISDFAKKHIKEFINKYILDKKDQIEEQSGNTIPTFELAAAVAAYIDTNKATASISPNAVVKSRGSVNVHARAENKPIVVATGSVEESQEGQNPGGGTMAAVELIQRKGLSLLEQQP